MPIYIELSCQNKNCDFKTSCDDAMLQYIRSRPCDKCGGPLKVTNREVIRD
ncbi:MAG: hypothetical protein RDU76_11490 [Candidatus Edwardsbacteria bacterium]|nr:hypothetical protein [Candidatus Edwardsbacteria bacterium]